MDAAHFGAFGIMEFCCAGIFGLLFLAFWIWMLVDCAVHEPSEGNDKIVWILIIVFLGVLGAFVYLVARRPQRRRLTGR